MCIETLETKSRDEQKQAKKETREMQAAGEEGSRAVGLMATQVKPPVPRTVPQPHTTRQQSWSLVWVEHLWPKDGWWKKEDEKAGKEKSMCAAGTLNNDAHPRTTCGEIKEENLTGVRTTNAKVYLGAVPNATPMVRNPSPKLALIPSYHKYPSA